MEEVAEKLYGHMRQEKGESFYEDFRVHAWVNRFLYGNSAIVLILNNNKINDKEKTILTYQLKKEIRAG